MNVIRQEIRTGLLVVISLAILIVVLLYLGSPGVFSPQKTYYVYAENAFGIKQGGVVAVAGRKVGQVAQLYSPVPEEERLDPKSEVMIEVRVNRSAKVYQRNRVTIAQNGLLGETF